MVGFETDQNLDDELEVAGGLTEELFPSAENWLLDSLANRNAIDLVSNKAKMQKYRSVLDYLVCEIFPNFESACLRFYRKKGPHLSTILKKDECIKIEGVIMKCLAYALVIAEARQQNVKVKLSWKKYAAAARKEFGF